MNSYMLPHGARSTASPLVSTATRGASAPSALRATAHRTHGPASHMALKAPTGRCGRGASAGTSPVAVTPSDTLAPSAGSTVPVLSDVPAPSAAPTVTSAFAPTTAVFASAAARLGRPNA